MSEPDKRQLLVLEHDSGLWRIAQERRRQIDQEGYTPAHDDKHTLGEISGAAGCYLIVGSACIRGSSAIEWPVEMFSGSDTIEDWPWDEQFWKPSDDPIRNLVKAGALIAAEIDRLLRMVPPKVNPPVPPEPSEKFVQQRFEDTK